MSLWTNIKLRGLRDILNPSRWMLFLRSKKGDVLGTSFKVGDSNITVTNEELQSYVEQVMYRESFEECRRCLNEGACTHCGCDRSLFLDPEMECSGGNWGKIMKPNKWREFKKIGELEEEYGTA